MKARREAMQQESDNALGARALTLILQQFELPCELSRNDAEYGLGWFRRTFDFPLILDARRVRFDLEQLFRKTDKSPLWDAYMTMLEEYGWDRQCGLITTFKQTMYLVHNDWSSQGEPGRVRMVRQAVDQGKGVIFEALQSYLDGLRASGWGR